MEVNNITLEAAMDTVRKWEASRVQASQMVTPSQEPGAGTNAIEESPGHGTKGKSVSTVVKKVALLRVKIVQPEVASAASVVNMVIMLAVAKGERT